MHRIKISLIIFLITASFGFAADTPMDQELTEDGITTIECTVQDKKEYLKTMVPLYGDGEDVKEIPLQYHYKLYVPKGYNENKDRYYPCIFIASPRGNAGMGSLRERYKNDEWLVVMLVESKNGSANWAPNFIAANDDAVKRLRIAKGLKFGTGFSGGARCSCDYPMMRKGFIAVLPQCADFGSGYKSGASAYRLYPPHVLVAGSFGTKDFNAYESHAIRRKMLNSKTHISIFEGGHAWAPKDTMEEALDWIEPKIFVDKGKKSKKSKAGALGKLPKMVKLDAESYKWYIRKCEKQLAVAEDDFDKFLLVEKILAVIKKGKITKDAAIKERKPVLSKQLYVLKKTDAVKAGIKANKAYLKAVKEEDKYCEKMKTGKSLFKKMPMISGEKKALEKAIKEYKKVRRKIPRFEICQAE